MKTLILILCAGLMAGCATTQPDTTKGAFGVAEQLANPQQKAALVQIRNLLVGKQVDPLAGFERNITYLYKGEPIDPADLSRKIVWERREGINDALFSLQSNDPSITSQDEDELRAEIKSILKAAGIQ
jgi:hypothetical protein